MIVKLAAGWSWQPRVDRPAILLLRLAERPVDAEQHPANRPGPVGRLIEQRIYCGGSLARCVERVDDAKRQAHLVIDKLLPYGETDSRSAGVSALLHRHCRLVRHECLQVKRPRRVE